MRPGDLVEWTYDAGGEPVSHGELLWSSVEETWVPIGSRIIHLLLEFDGVKMTWMNESGTFEALVHDVAPAYDGMTGEPVSPRARGVEATAGIFCQKPVVMPPKTSNGINVDGNKTPA